MYILYSAHSGTVYCGTTYMHVLWKMFEIGSDVPLWFFGCPALRIQTLNVKIHRCPCALALPTALGRKIWLKLVLQIIRIQCSHSVRKIVTLSSSLTMKMSPWHFDGSLLFNSLRRCSVSSRVHISVIVDKRHQNQRHVCSSPTRHRSLKMSVI